MVIKCVCGAVVRGETEEGLLEAVQRHISSEHPRLAGAFSPEDLLAMAEEE